MWSTQGSRGGAHTERGAPRDPRRPDCAPAHACRLGEIIEGCNHRQNLLEKVQDKGNPKDSRIMVAAATGGVAVCVALGTLTHPYLLSDNRHYTFYIWKDILGRSELVRLALAPVYALAGCALISQMTVDWGRLWTLNFVGACTLVLLPQWLVEFRYFIVPAFLAAVQVKAASEKMIVWNAVLLAVVNAVTLYVFVARPFTSADGDTARFMW